MGAPTIRDVASTAGVSVATVSRVINGTGPVNPATRDRVVRAMEDLSFTPSYAARRLSLGRTLTISVVVTFLTRPQAAERFRGVEAVLSDSEFDLVIYNVESPAKRDRYLRELPHAKRTDGLLVISIPLCPEHLLALAPAQVPVVVIDAHSTGLEVLPRVNGDDIAGGALATRHLLELGHRRIGFVGDAFENPFDFTSARDRFTGYRQALADFGISASPDLVALGGHGRYEARDLGRALLEGPNRPTAVFASSDTQALGVLSAARDLGLSVPGEVSIVGYDDIEAADYVGLTTIRQQLYESGRLGAGLLLQEIEERAPAPPSIELPPSIVVRATTAPPREDHA